MKKKTDPFDKDSRGRTFLFHAAESGDLEKVRNIIYSLAGTGLSCQRLSLINILDSSGVTAGEIAAKAGHKEIADLLKSEQMRMEFFE